MSDPTPLPRQGNVAALRYDRSIDEHLCEPVWLSVYRPPGDGLALYVTPNAYPADEFRIFLEPRQILELVWHLLVGAVRWRENRPWDADMTPAEREESNSHAF